MLYMYMYLCFWSPPCVFAPREVGSEEALEADVRGRVAAESVFWLQFAARFAERRLVARASVAKVTLERV